MKEHTKNIRSENGQVIVLYAIFILFLVVVGLSTVDLGKIVMFKTEVRQFTDQSAIAAESVEKETVPLLMNVQNTSSYARLVYSTGIMLQNYNQAAAKLNQYVSNYDQLSSWFYDYGDEFVDKYKNLADQFVTFPSGINYEDNAFLTMDPGIFDHQERLFKGVFSFAQLEKMIVYKELLDKNVSMSTQGWQNSQTIFIPAAYLLKRSPLAVIDFGSLNIYCKENSGLTTNRTSFYNGSFTEELRSGMLCYQAVNIPDLLMNDAIVTNNGKLGKQLMVSYSGLELQQGSNLPDEWIVEYNEKLHAKNIAAMLIIDETDDYVNPVNGNAWGLRKNYVKAKWDELELLYQDLFTELELIDSLEMESPHEFYTNATPRVSSMKSFMWAEDPAYVALATNMGYDLSVNDESESFYANVTLEDVFADENNFFQLIDDSIDTFDAMITNLFTDYPDFVSSISEYALDDTNYENSFPSILNAIVGDVESHASLSSENQRIVQYLGRLSSNVLRQNKESQDFQILISHRNGFNYSELKPSQELKVYLNKFFGESINKWEIN